MRAAAYPEQLSFGTTGAADPALRFANGTLDADVFRQMLVDEIASYAVYTIPVPDPSEDDEAREVCQRGLAHEYRDLTLREALESARLSWKDKWDAYRNVVAGMAPLRQRLDMVCADPVTVLNARRVYFDVGQGTPTLGMDLAGLKWATDTLNAANRLQHRLLHARDGYRYVREMIARGMPVDLARHLVTCEGPCDPIHTERMIEAWETVKDMPAELARELYPEFDWSLLNPCTASLSATR